MSIKLTIEAEAQIVLTFTGKHNDEDTVLSFCRELANEYTFMCAPEHALFEAETETGNGCIDAYGKMYDNNATEKKELKSVVKELKKKFK